MANPVLPAKFNLGSYLGEKIAPELQKGLSSGITQSYESGLLKNALEELGPAASHQQKLEKFLSLPISNETKKMGIEYLKSQPQAPSLGEVAKLVQQGIKGIPGVAERFEANPNSLLDLQERIHRSLANDPSQDDYRVFLNELNQKPQQQARSEAPQQEGGEQPKGFFGAPRGRGGDSLLPSLLGEQVTRGLTTGSLSGKLAGNELTPEQKEEMSKQGIWDDLKYDFGALLGDLPFFAALGPLGGAVTTGVGKVLADRIRKEVKKEGPTTMADVGKIAHEVIDEAAKSTIEGTLFTRFPFLRTVAKRIPGGAKVLENAVTEGLLRLAEQTATLAATRPALEGRLPSKEDVARALVFSTAMEGTRIPGELAKASPETVPKAERGFEQGALEDVRAAQEANIKRQGIERAQQAGQRILEPEKAQASKAANVPPGSEATGTVSRTVEGGPAEAVTARTISREAPVSPTIPQQQAATLGELRANAERVPRPQGQPMELEPLQEANRLAQMRGEPPLEVGGSEMNVRRQPETLVREQEKLDMLNKRVNEFDNSLRELRDMRKRRTEVSGKEREALDAQIKHLQEKIREDQRSLRKLAKEVQTGREPLEHQEIDNAIVKLRQRIVKEAVEPTEQSAKQQAQKIVREQKRKEAIEKANKLKGKDDGLPPDFSDSYTRVHEAYINEYNNLIKSAERQINELKGDTSPAGIQERKVAEKIRDTAKKGLEKAQADLTNYRHKKGGELVEKGAEKAAQVKERAKTEKKTEKVSAKSRKEMERLAKEYTEKPTKENAEKVAETIGVKPEEVTKAHEEAVDAGKKAARKILEFRRDRSKVSQSKETKAEVPKKKGNVKEALQQVKEESAKSKEISRINRLTSAHIRKIKEIAKEFGKDLSKGKLSTFWKNPLGRSILMQAGLTGLDEVIKEVAPEYKSFPKTALYGFVPSRGNPTRMLVTALFAAGKFLIHGSVMSSNVHAYKEALKSEDSERIAKAGQKLTPKQKKQAQADLRG